MGLGFSLDPAVPMSEAVRRVASAEIDAAYAALASPPERHKGVHDSRKCLKRLRSLLVLIEPGLPEPVFLSLTERLRTIARGLAPARDAAALLDAVDKFAKAEGEGEETPIPALRAWLQERRQAAKQQPRRKHGLRRHARPVRAPAGHGQSGGLSRRFQPHRQGLARILSQRAQGLCPGLRHRQRRGFPRVAEDAAASLAAYAAAHPLLAVGALDAGRGLARVCRKSSATITILRCSGSSSRRRP